MACVHEDGQGEVLTVLMRWFVVSDAEHSTSQLIGGVAEGPHDVASTPASSVS